MARCLETRAVRFLVVLVGVKSTTRRCDLVSGISGLHSSFVAEVFLLTENIAWPYSFSFTALYGSGVAFAGLNKDGDC